MAGFHGGHDLHPQVKRFVQRNGLLPARENRAPFHVFHYQGVGSNVVDPADVGVAEVLKISAQTVMRDWKMARAWLLTELTSGGKQVVRCGRICRAWIDLARCPVLAAFPPYPVCLQ